MMTTEQARAVSIQTVLDEMTLLHNVAKHQLITSKKSSSALNILTDALTQSGPSDEIQHFAHDVLDVCVKHGMDEFVLK